MKVLLVDDDQGTRLTLGLLLARSGLDVRSVADAQEALNMLREDTYDWLVTDAEMSPMNGFELALQARRIQAALRIVMISGVFEKRDTENYPISQFFSKPVDPGALFSYLKTA